MAHPTITSSLPFPVEILALTDEAANPVGVFVGKATFDLSLQGKLSLAKTQRPLLHEGLRTGDDGSSFRYEPESALIKLATDVVLVGHAYAPKPGTRSVDVGLKVGPVQKIVRVFGDRYWVKTGGQIFATNPQEFAKIPLVYERAFGGWDKSNKDMATWTFDPRNPVGRGFGDPLRYVEEGKVPMPNIEDPNHLIRRYGDVPAPAGLGFVSPDWQWRAKYAGTYDQAWDKQRKPLLPNDFDRRFFNSASPGLTAPGYLVGNEDVVLVNVAPVTPLTFRLPGLAAPIFQIELRGGKNTLLRANLDTVIIDTDEMLVFLTWRALTRLPAGPHDLVAVVATDERALAQAANA